MYDLKINSLVLMKKHYQIELSYTFFHSSMSYSRYIVCDLGKDKEKVYRNKQT